MCKNILSNYTSWKLYHQQLTYTDSKAAQVRMPPLQYPGNLGAFLGFYSIVWLNEMKSNKNTCFVMTCLALTQTHAMFQYNIFNLTKIIHEAKYFWCNCISPDFVPTRCNIGSYLIYIDSMAHIRVFWCLVWMMSIMIFHVPVENVKFDNVDKSKFISIKHTHYDTHCTWYNTYCCRRAFASSIFMIISSIKLTILISLCHIISSCAKDVNRS